MIQVQADSGLYKQEVQKTREKTLLWPSDIGWPLPVSSEMWEWSVLADHRSHLQHSPKHLFNSQLLNIIDQIFSWSDVQHGYSHHLLRDLIYYWMVQLLDHIFWFSILLDQQHNADIFFVIRAWTGSIFSQNCTSFWWSVSRSVSGGQEDVLCTQ